MSHLTKYLTASALALVTCSTSGACNIPVFRYALERWRPDACEVIVFHDAPLAPEQMDWSAELQKRSSQGSGNTNVKLALVDLRDDDTSGYGALWGQIRDESKAELPHVLIRTKLGHDRWINHWHGSLDDQKLALLLDSPARAELRQRLLAGHSIVWLIIGSTDDALNTKTRQSVTSRFEILAREVKLPEGIGLPGSELYAEVPLVVRFSLLEIDPADPKEQFLVRLLTGFQQNAFDEGEPLLVPVFGRGRALEVIPASVLDDRLMEDLTMYLSAACSCQVKERNPGFDLLIEADWEGELFGIDGDRPPDRSAEEGKNRPPAMLQIPPGHDATREES